MLERMKGWLPKARPSLDAATKVGILSKLISYQQPGQPIYSSLTVKKATRDGYTISIWVYKAVRTIIQAASAVPWVIVDKEGNPINGHPLEAVLGRPNPEMSGQDLTEITISHLELVGNAIWMPIWAGGQVKEIWPVMPDQVHPVPGGGSKWLERWDVEGGATLQPEQLIHFMQMDPGNPFWGISPLMAASKTVDTDNEAQDTQKVSMQNRGTPDGVFVHEYPLNQEQFEEAQRQIKEKFLQKSRRREPWILGSGTKWQQMSLTPVEMDYVASRLVNLRAIAAAFGLDPWWLGDRAQSTYNNVREARAALYEDVVIPLLDDISATLNLKIASKYEDGIQITYDLSGIPSLREDFGKKVDQAYKLWNMGVPFKLINERIDMGLDEFPGWDTGYLPMSLVPVGSPRPAPIEGAPSPPQLAEGQAIEEEEAQPAGEEEGQKKADILAALDKAIAEINEVKGGPGSGNWGHEGRPGEVGGSGEGGAGLSDRANGAKAAYKVSGAAIQRQAESNEPKLAKAVGGKQESDNKAFDVVKEGHGIEVKTIVRGEYDKITMNHGARQRKEREASSRGLKMHTVVFDERYDKIYYKEGVGSFRLSTMREVSMEELGGIFE